MFLDMTTMLPVADIERSARFYSEHLAFEVVSKSEQIARLERGAVSLFLVSDSPATEDKPDVAILRSTASDRSPVNLTFRVDDVRATHEALQRKGMTFLAPPAEKPWGEIRVFSRDPDGYLIEFYQPLRTTA